MPKRRTFTPDFKTVTWNAFHGTPAKALRPVLRGLLDREVSLFLMLEMARQEQRDMLEAAGLQYFFHPRQYVIAWDPAVWTKIDAYGVRLSDHPYWARGGDNAQYSEAAEAILCDKLGRSVLAQSYHTPAHIQVPANKVPKNRLIATKESAAYWRQRAKAAETRAVLFGGDDNVDETKGHGPWNFMLDKATGLTQVQAPTPTFGKRRIDDYRVKGLVAGPGLTLPGGGAEKPAHRVHLREWAWK